jgi:hypothetical protein
MKKWFYRILTILIFLFMTLSPVWSVLLVMKCEAGVMEIGFNYQMSYSQALIVDARRSAEWRKLGLEVKYDKL